jgi:hypothetical protein
VDLSDDHACIVVTQSCDLVHHDFLLEPKVEILVARQLGDEPDGILMHARNPRRLHFYLSVDGEPVPFEVCAPDRFHFPRELLGEFAPDGNRLVEEKVLRTLVAWLIARYDRSAFPDEFQRRLANIKKDRLKRLFDKLQTVREVFIALNSWEELAPGADYRIGLAFVMSPEDYENAEIRARTEETIVQIAGLLDGCEGIAVADDPMLRSEDEFTLSDARSMTRWGDFDYMSHRDDDRHVPPGRL